MGPTKPNKKQSPVNYQQDVSTKQSQRINYSYVTTPIDPKNNKLSVVQKLLAFIEKFLHIKLFDRKIEGHDVSKRIPTAGVAKKDSFEFNIIDTISTIETPRDYIQVHNTLITYNNLDRMIGYFSKFIDNNSDKYTINHDAVIDFLENNAKNIGSSIAVIDKKENLHNIIPPDIDYLRSLSKLDLKKIITQVNQNIKKVMHDNFKSRGYDADTERQRLAEALKSPALLKDIQNKNSFLLHVLETQKLDMEMKDGTMKVTYDHTDSEPQFDNMDIPKDNSNDSGINNIDSSVHDEDELFDQDIYQQASKLTRDLENAPLEDSSISQLPPLKDDGDDISPHLQRLLAHNKDYYHLSYEIDIQSKDDDDAPNSEL